MALPQGWAVTTLGDVASYINGRAFKPTEWETQGLPIIRIQNLNNADATYNYSQVRFEDKYLVRTGDLLFAWSASLGSFIWRGGDAWLNQHIFKVLPYDGVSKWYLYYYLLKTIAVFYSKTHGSGMVHITSAPFKETSFALPPLAEQHHTVAKIDALFSELDKGVEMLQTVRAQLRTYRQAVLKGAFDNIDGTKSIVDCFDITGGLTKNQTRNSLPNEKPYLRVANVYYNRLDLSEIKTIGVEDAEIDRTLLKKGDLLFVEGNGSREQIGRVAEWNGEIEECLHQNHIIKGRPMGTMTTKFAVYFLMTQEGRKQIIDVASSTSGLYTLSISKVKSLMLPFCPLNEQAEIIANIESRLSVCDKLEQLVDENLAKAQALRQSILKKAFAGELVPQDPNDEPAEKLLERIKALKAAAAKTTTARRTRK